MEIKGRHSVDRLRKIMSQKNMRTTFSESLCGQEILKGFTECSRTKLIGDQGKGATENDKNLPIKQTLISEHTQKLTEHE